MGVVRDIGLDISENDRLEYAKGVNPDCKITKMRRLNKRIKTNDMISYEPTTTSVVTFESNTLPKELVLFNTLSPVSVYIQPVIPCLKCLRYGHVRALCRGTFRCHKCGESHTDEQVCEGPNCVYCLEPHSSTDRTCKEYLRQKKIKECMAFYKISFLEANKNSRISPNLTSANFSSLSQDSQNLPQITLSSPFLSSQQSFSASIKSNVNQTSKSPNLPRKSSSVIQKRKVPTGPGYDRKAHENCLISYKPSNSNVFPTFSQSNSQTSHPSSVDLSPPKRMITSAQVHHSANQLNNRNVITRNSVQTRERVESMEEEDFPLPFTDSGAL
ncbi:uncharacterized protein LOC123686218 [Harmonia axyridis]|uniref:uncharacterized protein LOC123686218 n=1 Tax=Harmonia axyridis TaxID=115357 RepID=UPI001E27550F|nr:uncharacterized protein LOC123686218 [Harmonia axyridis]